MPIALVAAVAENNCIGKDGQLPWRIAEDMKHFKELTMGNTVLMGRKTWESIPEKFRPLPGRKNVVITRNAHYPLPPDVERFTDPRDAIASHLKENIFVIGGGEIYQQTLPLADTVYLTHVHQPVDGDTFFPSLDPSVWKAETRHDFDGFSFVTYKHV
jgi:dihydrofolate reductase